MARRRSSLRLSCLVFPCLILVLVAPSASAADLAELIEEYREAARGSAAPQRGRGGGRGGRPGFGRDGGGNDAVARVLDEISKLGTDESLAFLVGELRQSRNPPHIAAACAGPVVRHANPRAPSLALEDFGSRHPDVQRAILDAVAAAKRDVSAASKELLLAARASNLRPEVAERLPAALARLDSIDGARATLGAVPSEKGRGSGDAVSGYKKAAIEALSSTKSDSLKHWIANDGIQTASRSPAALEICLAVVEKLRLTDARDSVLKALAHRDPAVSAQAVTALVAIGVGDATQEVRRAVERHQRTGGLDFKVRALDALAASGDASAIDAVISFAAGKDPELRAIAMGSLALVAEKNEKALRALTDGLADRDPSVNAVALRALTRVRHKGMIAPLIGALDEKNEYGFRVNSLKLLVRLTGQNMGLVVADWKKWWEVAEARFEFPKGDEQAFTSVKAYGLDYFGIEISSKRLTFVVDVSGSMRAVVKVKKRQEPEPEAPGSNGRTVPVPAGGDDDAGKLGDSAQKIEVLKVELARVIKKLPADTSINIILFDGQFRPWQKELQSLAGRGRDKALEFVRSISTGGGTNVFDSLEHALEDRRVDTIYLMTDGEPTRGRITDPDGIVTEIERLNRVRGVTIHCIAFGEESDLLKRLAAGNGGDYRFVDEY